MATRNMKRQRFQTGMTLIELMVALAIGMFLMLGAVTVFVQGRSTFRTTESVSRVQENARFALDTIESDIRMAQYWGLTNRTDSIIGRATEAPLDTTTPATLDDCGANWPIDLDTAVAATNNGYNWACAGDNADVGTPAIPASLGPPPTAAIPATPGSDSFVVRRVAENGLTSGEVNTISAASPGTVFVQTSRDEGRIFTGNTPADFTASVQELHQLVVNGYYVSRQSTTSFPPDASGTQQNVPSLRMRTLVAGGVIQDREVIPGVEDMQIQFGIDTDPPGAPDRGAIDRYVNPGDALLGTSVVLAVRVWLRVRAERIEVGFVDRTTYNYADENATYNDNFRRVVVSKTIYLRNARI